MQCPVDTGMTITATSNAKWYGAPGPLKCGPKSLYPTTGYWDYSYECNKPWANPPENCTDYPDQKAGREVSTEAVPNRNGRTDVEGCCWWGRGAIQTSGICNYGRLNYYLGKRAADEGRSSRYPDVDLCKTPDAICSSTQYPELKWVAAMFYWLDSVQAYDEGGWNYLTALHSFVDGGMRGDSFINSVSGIVNRGCHNPPCASGPLDGGPDRLANFLKVLNILLEDHGMPAPPVISPVALPTDVPITITVPTTAPFTSVPIPVPTDVPITTVPSTDDMCCDPGETSFKPTPGCGSFYQCVNGEVYPNSLKACPPGLVFDVTISACNWAVHCVVLPCSTKAAVPEGQTTTQESARSQNGELQEGSSAPTSTSNFPMFWKWLVLIVFVAVRY